MGLSTYTFIGGCHGQRDVDVFRREERQHTRHMTAILFIGARVQKHWRLYDTMEKKDEIQSNVNSNIQLIFTLLIDGIQ